MLKLVNRRYSRKHITFNACWAENGKPALWGNYCLDNGSYYMAGSDGVIASGSWFNDVFQHIGVYNFDDVRRALRTGVLEYRRD